MTGKHEMKIKQFAESYPVKTRRDNCGEEIIPGKQWQKDMSERKDYRCHVYDNGDGRFGVCLLLGTVGKWNNAKKRLLVAGFALGQSGDTEGTLLFSPADTRQARAAIKEAGIRTRKPATSERLAILARARASRIARLSARPSTL
jgi:hypothetical protein